MTAGAEHIPEHRWARSRRPTFNTDCRRAFEQFGFGLASRGDARQITLDVGGNHRHAHLRETFGEHLQRDGLARAGRAGDQTMAVRIFTAPQMGRCTISSEAHTSERQSLLRTSYTVSSVKKQNSRK